MQLSAGFKAAPRHHHHHHHHHQQPHSRVVVLAAAGAKGFGAPKKVQAKPPGEVCPCGSNKSYKECCKRLHSGQAAVPSVEDTVRARFSAILKRDVSYLVKSTAPAFHSFHYGGEPGASTAQLTEDMQNTVDNYEYSALKIREVRKSPETPDEATAVFQYTVYDKRKPLVDDQNNKMRKVQIEESRFTRDDGLWLFTDYKLVEVPEALAKAAELQAQDMAAAAGGSAAGSTSSSS